VIGYAFYATLALAIAAAPTLALARSRCRVAFGAGLLVPLAWLLGFAVTRSTAWGRQSYAGGDIENSGALVFFAAFTTAGWALGVVIGLAVLATIRHRRGRP